MHGMLSLIILVAGFAGLMGWAVFVSVRLYRACSPAKARQARPDLADDAQAGASHLVS